MSKSFFWIRKTALLVAAVSMPVWAHASESGLSCERLFASAEQATFASPSSTRTLRGPSVQSKFLTPALADRFIQSIDQNIERDLRVVVSASQITSQDRKNVLRFFEHLKKRGLEIRISETEDGPNLDKLILSGATDLVLTALRHPAIQSIESVTDGGKSKRARWYFSAVAPETDRSLWHNRLPSKFEWVAFYRSARQKFVGPPGLLYEIAVKTYGLRPGEATAEFLSDIQKLGVRVSQLPKGSRSELLLSGPIDALFAIIRHPAIDEVLRLEEVYSDKQLATQKAETEQAFLKIDADLRVGRNRRTKIVFAGETLEPHSVLAFRDPQTPEMIRLAEREGAKEKEDKILHEVRTARDYAKFLRRNFDQDFAYVAEFKGSFVPVFDGLVLHRTSHEPIANVSMKYFAVQIAETRDSVFGDVKYRFSELRKKQRNILARPADWFGAVNNLPPDMVRRPMVGYDARITQARELISLFGLFPRLTEPTRETRIVVDMRDHGIRFSFFKNEDILNDLKYLASINCNAQVSMTLIWNSRQAVELTMNGVRLYE